MDTDLCPASSLHVQERGHLLLRSERSLQDGVGQIHALCFHVQDFSTGV